MDEQIFNLLTQINNKFDRLDERLQCVEKNEVKYGEILNALNKTIKSLGTDIEEIKRKPISILKTWVLIFSCMMGIGWLFLTLKQFFEWLITK